MRPGAGRVCIASPIEAPASRWCGSISRSASERDRRETHDAPGVRNSMRLTGTASRAIRVQPLGTPRTPPPSSPGLDGKWLLRTSDVTLTPDDLAAAYKQLLAVERGGRDLKGAPELRPVFNHREDRIRAHIQLCWLALLLLRVIENTTGDTCATSATN